MKSDSAQSSPPISHDCQISAGVQMRSKLLEPVTPSSLPPRPTEELALKEALEDIDAYLETMPAKTNDWSIGYKAITPYVKSLRLLREQFEGRGEVISELLNEFDAIVEALDIDESEKPISQHVEEMADELIRLRGSHD